MRSLSFSNNRARSLVGKVTFAHDEIYSSSTAFEISEAAKIRILLPRILGVVSVSVHVFKENLSDKEDVISASWCDSKKEYDIYEVEFYPNKFGVGLYFFLIEIDSQCANHHR